VTTAPDRYISNFNGKTVNVDIYWNAMSSGNRNKAHSAVIRTEQDSFSFVFARWRHLAMRLLN